jgi:hypothetical protein
LKIRCGDWQAEKINQCKQHHAPQEFIFISVQGLKAWISLDRFPVNCGFLQVISPKFLDYFLIFVHDFNGDCTGFAVKFLPVCTNSFVRQYSRVL